MKEKHNQGHRERLRKKFLNAGIEGLHDYEAIELLLTFAVPRKDVKPIAKQLLKKFKNISGLLDASHEELRSVAGIAESSTVIISLVKELCGEYLADKMKECDVLSSPEAVRDFARMKMAGMRDEAFMVIYLNTKNHVNNYEMICEGTVDHAVIYPRKIVKKALAYDASGLILIHNHPSGMCEPSKEDISLTEMIKDTVKTLNIRLLDHIIVGKSGYFSFVEKDIL